MSATLVAEMSRLSDTVVTIEDAIIEVMAEHTLPPFIRDGFVSDDWKSAVHLHLIRSRPELGPDFVDWYMAADAEALRTNRPPKLPIPSLALRYPVLSWGPNGQVDILTEDDPVYPR